MRLLPLLGLLVIVLGVVAVTATVVRRPFQSRDATVAQARRHAGRIAGAALVVGVLAALAAGFVAMMPQVTGVAMPGRAGVAAISIPLAFGLAHTGTVLVGELTWPRPAGNVRRARLVRRGLLDSAPRWLLRLAAAALIVGLAVVLGGALLSSPDGRTVTVAAAGGRVHGAASPFAGTDYGVPMAAGLLCLAALTVGALWAVTERPALGTADESAERALRQASALRVLRGATTAGLVAVGGLLTVSGQSLRQAALDAADTATAQGLAVGAAANVLPWVGGLLALIGLFSVLAGLGVFLVRVPRVRLDALRAADA